MTTTAQEIERKDKVKDGKQKGKTREYPNAIMFPFNLFDY